jgi:membrane fusion protein (multidrug efflux system)
MNSNIFRRVILAVVIVAAIAAIAPAYRYYLYAHTHVSTDDAYVDGTVAIVAPRVGGTISNVYVQDNWIVKQGDLLITLDSRDFEVRVEQARAQLQRAMQSVDELEQQVASAEAGLALVGSQLTQAKIDFERARQLKAEGVMSNQSYDQAATGLKIADADHALATHQLAQAKAALGGSALDGAKYQRPIVRQAHASMQAAELELTYTKIAAPFAGIITRKSAHVGNRVQMGEPLMAVVPFGRLYFTANYKETQLTDVRVGQSADVEADLYPGFVYHGHVDSISMGTGSAFSLLPPENATGNWVKVVQRVPVKIVLDEQPPAQRPLRIGLSVEVSINISDTSGPLLSSTGQKRFQRGDVTMPNESLNVPPIPNDEKTPPAVEPHQPAAQKM